ncbi:MAG: chromate efflux transporter [Pseudomonadota bacterium]
MERGQHEDRDRDGDGDRDRDRDGSEGDAARGRLSSPREIFAIFLRLGLTSFGGPVAHLGFFREEFVQRRRWLSDAAYAELVALCQFTPGPASSQVGLAIGLMRGGGWGALAAWAGFTLPSAAALILFALGVGALTPDAGAAGWLMGVKAAAVAVVALALWSMARSLAPDAPRAVLAALSAAALVTLGLTGAFGPGSALLAQLGVILGGAVAGVALGPRLFHELEDANTPPKEDAPPAPVSRSVAAAALALLALILLASPFIAPLLAAAGAPAEATQAAQMGEAYFRAGALVFGGGHVVLPLLEADAVGRGWVAAESFVAGYGAAQAVPGPLFTFAAYLGAAADPSPNGVLGGVIALAAIFAPSALLVVGVTPFWSALRGDRRARAALAGVNAAVVGLLAAAFVNPVLSAGVTGPSSAAIALLSGVALHWFNAPPWAVVAAAALLGAAMAAVGWP